MRFFGNIEAKIDAKGRVFLPSTFRKILQATSEASLIMRKDIYQDCLVLFPESIWNQQLDELRQKLNKWDPAHQQLFRQYVSNVEIITLDGNGRILIPKRLQALAYINQEVRFIGMDSTIEIWDKVTFEQHQMEPQQFRDTFNALMANHTNPTLQNNE